MNIHPYEYSSIQIFIHVYMHLLYMSIHQQEYNLYLLFFISISLVPASSCSSCNCSFASHAPTKFLRLHGEPSQKPPEKPTAEIPWKVFEARSNLAPSLCNQVIYSCHRSPFSNVHKANKKLQPLQRNPEGNFPKTLPKWILSLPKDIMQVICLPLDFILSISASILK